MPSFSAQTGEGNRPPRLLSNRSTHKQSFVVSRVFVNYLSSSLVLSCTHDDSDGLIFGLNLVVEISYYSVLKNGENYLSHPSYQSCTQASCFNIEQGVSLFGYGDSGAAVNFNLQSDQSRECFVPCSQMRLETALTDEKKTDRPKCFVYKTDPLNIIFVHILLSYLSHHPEVQVVSCSS